MPGDGQGGEMVDLERQGMGGGGVEEREGLNYEDGKVGTGAETEAEAMVIVIAGNEAGDVVRGAEGGEGTKVEERSDKSESGHLKKMGLPSGESFHEECRVCQQQTDEVLIDLGCQCRGELAKAHRSCIEKWFRTRGSNKCEICQQMAANIPSPQPQPNSNYWVWRVDPAFRGSSFMPGQGERGCYSPLWIAFSILIGGLLLDVLISISLGVSALPVNIIIGVLVVLGLGTALRLALECCHECSLRRVVQRVDTNVNPGYHPTV